MWERTQAGRGQGQEAGAEHRLSGDFEFRTPRHGARNKANTPDKVEAEALQFFQNNPGAVEWYTIDAELNAVRYFRPVHLSESCLNCHGSPSLSLEYWNRDDGRDISGFEMDNKKVGDLHGAFEVIRPLEEAQALIREGVIKSTIIGLVGLLIVLVGLWFLLKRYVSEPIGGVAQTLDRAGREKDLRLRLPEEGSAELIVLGAAFNGYANDMHGFTGEVVDASMQVAASAEELAGVTEETSAGVEEQKVATEGAMQALAELLTASNNVAQQAQRAAEVTGRANLEARRGGKEVSAALKSMESLADQVRDSVGSVRRLNDQVSEIAQIIDVIGGIAQETDLLALNAATEATRAGRAGDGFAVVAAKVRSLSMETQASTKRIRTLIRELESRSVEVSTSMSASEARVAKVEEDSIRIQKAFKAIVKQLEEVAETTGTISQQVANQSRLGSSVSQHMDGIQQVGDQTAVGAKETARASQALAQLASRLQQTVGEFQV